MENANLSDKKCEENSKEKGLFSTADEAVGRESSPLPKTASSA
jgi:hypothetical protein